VSGPCDDGSDCTEDDFGLCCTPEFTGPTAKVTSFSLGEAGIPGHALDVDNDPDTCSPASNCESGIDNSLSAFASLANEPLAEEVANGGLIALIELKGFNVEGELFEIHFWEGEKVDGACDLQTMSCDYWVKESAISASCSSLFNFDNAEVTNGKLSAGGIGYGYPILLKIGGADIALELENAKLEADLVLVNGQPTELTGVIGGAVSKSVLASALSAIPDDQLPDGISKQALLTLVNVLIKNDIDLDSDGTPDAASIGVRVQAISGTIVGVEP
jgi:hypothetical protein